MAERRKCGRPKMEGKNIEGNVGKTFTQKSVSSYKLAQSLGFYI